MLFFLKHIVGILLMPPAINFLLILVGGLLLKYYCRVGKILIVIGVVSLWLFSTSFVAKCLISSLQSRYPALSVSQLKYEKNAAIVVLEAGLNMTTPEYGNRPIVSDRTLARLRYAAFIYRKTHIPILVSGNDPFHPTIDQTIYMADALKTFFHIPTKWYENKGYDTSQEALQSIRILKKFNIKKIYLVTSAFHMPRSMQLFQRRGIEIIPAPTDFENISVKFRITSFIPTAGSLVDSDIALHEYLGIAWNRLCWFFDI